MGSGRPDQGISTTSVDSFGENRPHDERRSPVGQADRHEMRSRFDEAEGRRAAGIGRANREPVDVDGRPGRRRAPGDHLHREIAGDGALVTEMARDRDDLSAPLRGGATARRSSRPRAMALRSVRSRSRMPRTRSAGGIGRPIPGPGTVRPARCAVAPRAEASRSAMDRPRALPGRTARIGARRSARAALRA